MEIYCSRRPTVVAIVLRLAWQKGLSRICPIIEVQIQDVC